ncbi:MAG TPA: HupE / UreJ protein [Flavobacterium sp.]|nr:HupE / UreJ protein [Flavobacterium sp.]
MSEFWIYIKAGIHHILDITAYNHVFFLVALMIPYVFKDWKRVFILVSLLTIGNALALILSVYNIVTVNSVSVSFLKIITILLIAFYALNTAGKTIKSSVHVSFIGFITLFFGMLHGFEFSSYFKTILPKNATEKLIPSLEIALGIEVAQILIAFIILILSYIVQTFFKYSKKDWALIMAAFVIGVMLHTIIERKI